MPCEQKRQQRKSRQRVMRKFRFYERENNGDDRNASDEVIVDLVAISPDLCRQPGQFDRPRKEAHKDRNEIKRQEQQVHPKRFRAVSFHR